MNRWETGATGASEENIARLAEFFGVSRAYLLGCDDGNGNGIEAAA